MIPPQQYQPSGRAILLVLSLSRSPVLSEMQLIWMEAAKSGEIERWGAHPLALCLPAVSLLQKSTFFFHYGYPPSVYLHMASNPTIPAQHPNSCRDAPDNLALISENRKSLVRDRLLLFVCLFLIELLTLCCPKRPPSLTFGMSHRCVSLQGP